VSDALKRNFKPLSEKLTRNHRIDDCNDRGDNRRVVIEHSLMLDIATNEEGGGAYQ
jgi:hypothetical protein